MLVYVIIPICLLILIFGSRLIVNETNELSKLMRTSAFGLSVLLLGFLTSLPEFSVTVTAQLDQQPQIYAGNLMGGVFLLIAGIIPLLIALRGGMSVRQSLHGPKLVMFMVLLSLPLLAALNGVIDRLEAGLMILAYLGFVLVAKPVSSSSLKSSTRIPHAILFARIAKIIVAAVAIFIASSQLVKFTEVAALEFGIPTFVISLVALAIGTNIPEITLAIQAIVKRKTQIAFGDYVGSAAVNPLILGLFSFYHGPYALGVDNLLPLICVFLGANVLFLLFASSRQYLSKREALMLLCIYAFATVVQFVAWPQI